MNRRLLILGCGDLGRRIAGLAAAGDWAVTGLRRHPPATGTATGDILDWRRGDLGAAGGLVAVAGHWDAVVYCPAPGTRTPEAYRAVYGDGLARALRHVDTERFVLVTSTAVYGESDGSWVDETTPCRPDRFNGEILMAAERLLHGRPGGIVARPAGLYGPGRERLIRSVGQGRARARTTPPQWTNRIHVDDAAGSITRLLDLETPEPVYCLADDCPAPRREVLAWLADRLGAPAPVEDVAAAGCGRRVSNARLRATGFRLRYPDYRSGYADILEEARSCRS